jgi:7-keto-8-aminopelargonate synthetase-like enzyme
LRRGDIVFSDALNHASLIDGMRLSGATKLIYPHLDLAFLESALESRRASRGARVIVTESVFSMEGDIAPLDRIVQLARQHDAAVVVDEAHATGTLGPQGRGIAVSLGIEEEMLAVVHTCGKALASAGAFVCGSATVRDFLINRARSFVFSTAMPPYMAGQTRAAVELVRDAEEERGYLHEIADFLRAELSAAGISIGSSTTHIIPVILGTEEAALAVATALQNEGFAIRAIRPPTVPPGTSRVRISLTARISREEIRRLAAAVIRAHEAFNPGSRPIVHA